MLKNKKQEKMLAIPVHKEYTNHKITKVPPHSCSNSYDNEHQQQYWRGCGEKRILIHCWWECKLIQPLWKTIWRLLKKLNIDLTYDPAILLPGIHLKEIDSGYYKGSCRRMH
jgi:hypothetical protein